MFSWATTGPQTASANTRGLSDFFVMVTVRLRKQTAKDFPIPNHRPLPSQAMTTVLKSVRFRLFGSCGLWRAKAVDLPLAQGRLATIL
jgi:hypothetical protein